MSQNRSDEDLEVVDLAAQVDLPTPGTLVPPGGGSRRRASGSDGGGHTLLWLLAVVVVLAIWAGVALVSLMGVRSDVLQAREDLLGARDDLLAGEVDAAVGVLEDTAATLGGVPGRVESPLVWPARILPSHRRSLDAVASLGRAGQVAAGAIATVGSEIADGDGGLGALSPRDGRLPVEAIAALAPVLDVAAQDLEQARDMVERVPARDVDQAVADGRAELLDLLGPTTSQLRLGAEVAEALPRIFGADGPRRYLVMAANPTENRGTGGFFGAYVVLEADQGQLTFGTVGETTALPIPPDEAVDWPDPSLEARYDLYGGATRVRSMNMTPDFPAAAQTLEAYWAAAMGEEVDGVIAVDPFAFQTLLRISGPTVLEGFEAITAEEVVDFVSYTAYSLIDDPERRKRLIGEVAMGALQTFLEGPDDVGPGEVLAALGEMVRQDSLLMHATDPDAQAMLVDLGMAGELDHDGRDLLALVLNSGSGSKIDYWLERSLRYDVQMGDDGSSVGQVTALFVNQAPSSGEIAYMIGPPLGYPVDFDAGDNISFASLYCAPGCTFGETPDIGYADLPTTEMVELGYPVASTWMRIPSTQSRQLLYSFQSPEGWTTEGADLVYRLRYLHQTAVRPTDLQVRVRIPEGHTVGELPDDARVEDGEVVLEVEAREDIDLEVTFPPS